MKRSLPDSSLRPASTMSGKSQASLPPSCRLIIYLSHHHQIPLWPLYSLCLGKAPQDHDLCLCPSLFPFCTTWSDLQTFERLLPTLCKSRRMLDPYWGSSSYLVHQKAGGTHASIDIFGLSSCCFVEYIRWGYPAIRQKFSRLVENWWILVYQGIWHPKRSSAGYDPFIELQLWFWIDTL